MSKPKRYAIVEFHARVGNEPYATVFAVGDEIPDSLEVGDHVFGSKKDANTAADDVSGPTINLPVPDAVGDGLEGVDLDALADTGFNPADATVAQTLAHLERSDEGERDRVLGLERAGGKRKGILGDEG